jgi:aminoglycoside phosphotransferase (APT) family kinase protein
MSEVQEKSSLLIDTNLVRRLIAWQFPEWNDLAVIPVLPGGWDNRTFRLGDNKLVRLPSAPAYVDQVEKEQIWLPKLAAHLSLPIPTPIAKGSPTNFYSWPWSIYGWLDGDPASDELVEDKGKFARSLAKFLTELHHTNTSGAPQPGPHNFFRGGLLATYDGETRSALEALSGSIDTDSALAVWEAAVSSRWEAAPVWVHGDVASENLLVRDGKLHAVIDFGCAAVGDPACDLTIAWTLFDQESRQVFRSALSLDASTWARGRGWALWKALITMAKSDGSSYESDQSRQVILRVLDDHREALGA